MSTRSPICSNGLSPMTAALIVVRHPHVEELFQWKNAEDKAEGVESYPFENAEARFAIGVFQALGENDTETKLQNWITQSARSTRRSQANSRRYFKRLQTRFEPIARRPSRKNSDGKRKKIVSDKQLDRSPLHGGSQIFRLGFSGTLRQTVSACNKIIN